MTINDPLDRAGGKNRRLSRADFRAAWEQMGKQALTYLPVANAALPALAEQTAAACSSKTIPAAPTTRSAAQLAPFELTASHAIAWSDLRPGGALNRNVAGVARHVAFFAGWADAARTTACVVQPNQGTTASTKAYGTTARNELTPIRFESSPAGYRSEPIGVDCSVHGDGKLCCKNTAGAAMHAEPNAASARSIRYARATAGSSAGPPVSATRAATRPGTARKATTTLRARVRPRSRPEHAEQLRRRPERTRVAPVCRWATVSAERRAPSGRRRSLNQPAGSR